MHHYECIVLSEAKSSERLVLCCILCLVQPGNQAALGFQFYYIPKLITGYLLSSKPHFRHLAIKDIGSNAKPQLLKPTQGSNSERINEDSIETTTFTMSTGYTVKHAYLVMTNHWQSLATGEQGAETGER